MLNSAALSDLFQTQILSGDENLLVNCAGIREIVPLDALSLDTWDDVLAINLTAPFVLSRAFGKAVIANEATGSIVNIASVAGILGEPERTA